MSNHLIITSKPLLIDINSYEAGRAIIRGYKILDSYDPQDSLNHGRYRIIIKSPSICCEDELEKAAEEIRTLINDITLLLKCILGESINVSDNVFDSFTKEVIFIDQMPIGWTSNYQEIKKRIEKQEKIKILVKGWVEHYFHLKESPFNDLIKALNSYDKLTMQHRDLLSIINEIDIVSKTSRYMLIGKGLEIVDSFYPLEHNRKDNRIQHLFPECTGLFKGITLKKLLELANTRRESRHYIADKKTSTPHPQMTEKELKRYYQSSNLLFINVLRKALGLEVVTLVSDIE